MGETSLVRLILLLAFLQRTEHPLCHGLVANAELESSVQDGGSEDGVGVPLPRSRSRAGLMRVHRWGEESG